VSQGTVSPAFSPEVQLYTVAVPVLTDSIQVTAAADPCATLTINGVAAQDGSAVVPLSVGAAILTLTVRAPDGTTNSYTVVVVAAPAVYFKASNTSRQGQFGFSVSVSGDTLDVGTVSDASNATGINGNQADRSAPNSGAVFVFVRRDGLWSQQAYIKASNAETSDTFGHSVSLSGDTLAVGATGESRNATGVDGNQADNSARGSGAVYVFTRSGGVWSQQAYIKASNTQSLDNFGHSLSLSGDTLAVGVPFESSSATGINGDQADNSALQAGAVYVFARSGGVWSQQAYVKASNTNAADQFGRSVAVSGDTLAVGARYEQSAATGINGNQADNSAFASGAVYVFQRSGSVWAQQAYVKASNTDKSDFFGIAVSLSGDTLAVGAPTEASSATGINGNQADNSALASGAVYVFQRSGSVWAQQAYLKASNAETGDQFGSTVSLSGDNLAVGAPYEKSQARGINGNQADNSAPGSGAVYVFARRGGAWSQKAYVKASNADSGDTFGWSVSLSDATLAVTAPYEGSSATGINGNQADNSAPQAGAVYVY
jgi:hypothetical protein